MLSKSQAKAFFLFGTALFSAIFIGLTIDTFQRIPAQTNADGLTPSVIRGKHLFEQKNCMGCHTIMGEGAYYAPELTKVFERRGEVFIKAMLRNPEAMYPGQRKMINYGFKDEEINDLTDFLKWVGTMNLNGFPPKPDLVKMAAPGQSESAIVESRGRPQVFNQMCIACHSLQGQGGQIGPALDDVGARLERAYITSWLRDPTAVKADSKMPKLPLSEEEITELAAFLITLTGGKK